MITEQLEAVATSESNITPASLPVDKSLTLQLSGSRHIRRAGLALAVLAGLSLLVLGADIFARDVSSPTQTTNPVSTGSVDQNSRIRPIDYVLHPGLENPIYRAGSIILSVADDSKHGQGSLVETKDGLAILTVDHVAKALDKGSKFYVPGVGTDTLDISSFVPQPKLTKDDDPTALIPLHLPPDHPLMEAVANGSIKPLTLANPGFKLILQEVAIPNPVMSEFTRERVESYSVYTNQYALVENVFCQGQSGSPVLNMENGQVINRVVGVISGLPDPLLEDPLGRLINGRTPVYCGATIVVRGNSL